MELIKINPDHYVIVDYLEIKIGDWVYVYCSEIQVEEICQVIEYYNEQFIFRDGSQIHLDYCHKITHSTKPIEVYYDDMTGKEVWHYDKVQYFIPEVQGNKLNPFIQKMKL